MGRPFAIIGFTMFATLFFICYIGENAAIVLLCLSAALIALFCSFKRLRKQKALLLAFVAAAFASALFLIAYQTQYVPVRQYLNREVTVAGIAKDYPDYQYNAYYYDVRVAEVNGAAPASGFNLRVSFDEDIGAVAGDRVEFKARLYELGAHNETNRLNYLSKKIFVGAYCFDGAKVIVNTRPFKGWNVLFADYRHALILSLQQLLPSDNAALSAAVLTGDKTYIDSQILENINKVSISHIICVSGLHLSIIGAFVITVFRKLHFPRKLRYLCAGAVIFFFMALCGFTGSVVRAGIMFLIYIVGELILAEPDSKNSLGFAAMVILFNPFNAVNIGFTFSFLATLTIISLGAPICRFLKERWSITEKKRPLKLLFSLLEILIISLCVNVCTLPLSTLIFKRVSFIGLAANVLILPMASLLVISSGMTALLGLLPLQIFGVIAYPFAFFNSALSAYVLKIVDLLSKSRYASIFAGEPVILVTVSCVFLLLALTLLLAQHRKQVIAAVSVVCVVLMTGSFFFADALHHHRCEITVHAAGYAPCITVRQDNTFCLIDTGADGAALTKIENSLFAAGCEGIDCLVLTGDTRAESGNTARVFRRYEVNTLLCDEENQCLRTLNLNRQTKVNAGKDVHFASDSGLKITFRHDTYSAVLVNFSGVKVLILNSDKYLSADLPSDMQAYDYLIVRGKVNKYIVNSAVNGIIEMRYNPDSTHEREWCDYALYSTANNNDVKIVIGKTKTTIGSVNKWRL